MKLTAKQLLALLLCATLSHTALASKNSEEKAKEKKEQKENEEKKNEEQKKKHDDAEKKKQEDHQAEVAAEAAAKAAHEAKLREQEAANRAERLAREAAEAAQKKAHEEKLAKLAAEQRAAKEKAAAEQAARQAAKTAQEKHEIKLKQEAVDRAKEALATAARKEAQWVAINGPRPPRPQPPVPDTPEEEAQSVVDLQAIMNSMTPYELAELAECMGLNVNTLPGGTSAVITPAQAAARAVEMFNRLKMGFSSVKTFLDVVGKADVGKLGALASSPIFKSVMAQENTFKAMKNLGLVVTGTQTAIYYAQAWMYAGDYVANPTDENLWKSMVASGKGDANMLAMTLSLQKGSPQAAGFGLANMVLALAGQETATSVIAKSNAIAAAVANPKTNAVAMGAIKAVLKDTAQAIQTNDQQFAFIQARLLNPATSAETGKIILDALGQQTQAGFEKWKQNLLNPQP